MAPVLLVLGQQISCTDSRLHKHARTMRALVSSGQSLPVCRRQKQIKLLKRICSSDGSKTENKDTASPKLSPKLDPACRSRVSGWVLKLRRTCCKEGFLEALQGTHEGGLRGIPEPEVPRTSQTSLGPSSLGPRTSISLITATVARSHCSASLPTQLSCAFFASPLWW